MSRRTFHRYLSYYLTATAILVCESSQKTPRRASCPSCGQDCPEALASPWYPRQELDLQVGILQDFSVTPLQNSPYFRLAQREISQNTAHDDVLSGQNPMFPRRHRSFSQQGSAKDGYPRVGRLPIMQFVDKTEQQNSFLGNFPNKFSEFLGKQTTLSLDKPANSYPVVTRVSPPKQDFHELEQTSSFFGSLRDKYSMSSSEIVEDCNTENEQGPAREFNVVYRANRKPSWGNSRHISPNEIVPRKFFPIFRQASILDGNDDDDDDGDDEQRNAIERPSNSIGGQYNNLASPRDIYHSAGVGVSRDHCEPYVLSPDSSVETSAKNGEVLGDCDLMKDSSETSSLRQSKSIHNRNYFFRPYSMEEEEIATIKDDNEQMNYLYNSLQDSYIWRSTKDERVSPNSWNLATGSNLQNLIEINRGKGAESNWPQVYSATEGDIGYFDVEEDKDREYSENEAEKDTIEIETSVCKPYALPLDMHIWRTTHTHDKNGELPDKRDLMYRLEDLQGIQKTGQSRVYSVEENSNKYSQGENKFKIQDETRIGTDRIIRAPVIDVTPCTFPQSFLNILNSSKYPTESTVTMDLSEMKNNISRVNSTERRHERFSEDGERNRDQIFVKDMYDAEKYKSLALDRGQDAKDNTQNETLTELDPDLIDEAENPPVEPTKRTPIESFDKHSTSITAKESS
ncbi:uncharacterized protein LOC105182130 [Harpegnathos saltator]|uniref:Uncharacterized protein n=1 Tax=Harpegnathos saltator TaxID=610380 RepID=E2BF71_HARSA|nr:uncharacterized protein LOC105182130 [Harpegnathos saltator]EFN85657.1 hypothetical protein EAI_04437 [Harpegnathos saltator]